MKTRVPLLFFLIFALDVTARAAPLVTIIVDTGSRSITEVSGVPLSGGLPLVNGDGAVVQIGYHPGATIGHNFGPDPTPGVTAFVPLIGEGGSTGIKLTIGDMVVNGTGNGEVFVDDLNIFVGTNGLVLPPVGTPLVIRFYNGFSLATSTAFEEVSNNLWLWQTPRNPPIQQLLFLNLDDSGLIAFSGVNVAAPGTNIKVPPIPPLRAGAFQSPFASLWWCDSPESAGVPELGFAAAWVEWDGVTSRGGGLALRKAGLSILCGVGLDYAATQFCFGPDSLLPRLFLAWSQSW